jgi:hypothetical protein
MTSQRKPTTANPHGIPAALPDDGTPFTIVTETTHRKILGDSPMNINTESKPLTVSDFEETEWTVEVQTANGFQFLDQVANRPYDPDLRDLFGPGVYKSYPQGPDGRPLTNLATLHKIIDPAALQQKSKDSEKKHVAETPPQRPTTARDWKSDEDMPAWMRLQLEKSNSEAAEARRRSEEAEIRRQEWERSLQLKESEKAEREENRRREREDREDRERREKQEREDRERKDRLERELRDSKERAERDRADREDRDRRDANEREAKAQQMEMLIKAGTSLAGAFISSRPVSGGTDLNAEMLKAVLANSNKPAAPQTSMKDYLDFTLAIDQLRNSNSSEKDEDDGLMGLVKANASRIG